MHYFRNSRQFVMRTTLYELNKLIKSFYNSATPTKCRALRWKQKLGMCIYDHMTNQSIWTLAHLILIADFTTIITYSIFLKLQIILHRFLRYIFQRDINVATDQHFYFILKYLSIATRHYLELSK